MIDRPPTADFRRFTPSPVRSFEKGLAGRGGWREEILPMPEIQTSSCALFPMPPLGEGEHNYGDQLLLYSRPRQTATPSRQPLFDSPLLLEIPKSETGIGGVKTYRTLEGGGELAPKVAPRKLGLLTSKWRFSIETL